MTDQKIEDHWEQYQKILDRKETPEWNDIDRAAELLETLLDDPEQLIGDNAGAVIQNAINLIL